MKKIFFFVFLISSTVFSQKTGKAFKEGEYLKFKITYGLLSAGFITLEVKSVSKNQMNLYHVNGRGWTNGMVDLVFSVEDNYQTYIDQKTLRPYHFIRKVDEGGYLKNKEIYFDFLKHQAKVIDHKHSSQNYFFIQNDVHDMLSSLYFLRSLNFAALKTGDIIGFNMFFDEQMNKINLRFKGREYIQTKFGKVKTLVFKPMVQTGRIFKDKETVTLWITDDKNKIPIKVKANILVGSIKAELIETKGLAN
ncbi:MAG: DUF3108 domain-containing protein [Flavobacteriaceae bacterium]|nr:DUF3108 domain-containing protein [Flavobacteriaceae bacterium]